MGGSRSGDRGGRQPVPGPGPVPGRGAGAAPATGGPAAAAPPILVRPCHVLRRQQAIAVARIYHEAFPPAQRIGDSALFRLVPAGPEELGGWTFHLAEHPHETVGFAAGLHVSHLRLAYLAYLAVAGTWRGQGAGTALLESLIKHWVGSGPRPPHWLFLEVERPELAAEPADRALRERRIRFYTRHGFQRLEADFQAPPLGPELPVVPYWVLMLPLIEPDLRPATIRTALADLYREVYGLAEDHPLVANCLGSFRAP